MKIIVIGGVAAGMSIAAKAKRTNPDVEIYVIEREDYLSFGACGLPYYLGGQFDDINEMFSRTKEDAERQGINVMSRHEVSSIDFDKKSLIVKSLDEDKSFEMSYDKLAIAVGARPTKSLDLGVEDSVYTITKPYEVDSLKELIKDKKEIIIIGGGFIALETAEQLRGLGKNVKILQRSDRLMRRVFDPDFSELLKSAMLETGVELLLNNPIESYEKKDNEKIEIKTPTGVYEADVIIQAIGFRPNTDFITDSRLKKLPNGAIIIDEYGRTSIDDVYAAGDCASVFNRQQENFYSPLATYANKMGRIVGINIASSDQFKFTGALASSSIRLGEKGAGATGLNEEAAKKLGLDFAAKTVTSNNHSNYWPNQEKITIKIVYNKKDGVILGAQIFGPYGAVERLGALTMAVYNKNTVEELGFIDFAYSPPYASVWDALNVAGNAIKI